MPSVTLSLEELTAGRIETQVGPNRMPALLVRCSHEHIKHLTLIDQARISYNPAARRCPVLESGHWISVVCLALTCDELFSSMQASFSKVDVVLDATKDFVIDRFLVA